MNGTDEKKTPQPDDGQDDSAKRNPDEASEDQLDEALEETFPASDPISP